MSAAEFLARHRRVRQGLWFVALWLAGLAVVSAVAMVIKGVLM